MKQTVFLYGPKPSGPLITSKDRPFRQWELDGSKARLVHKSPIEVEVGNPEDDASLLLQLKKHLGSKIENKDDWKLYRAPFAANQFFPRIYRPVYSGAQDIHLRVAASHLAPPFDEQVAADTSFQLSVMVKSLQRICAVVSPTEDNLDVYGHEIRNLLIVACTEFEAQCKGILHSNGYEKAKMSTQDYVKLLPVLKLSDYSARISPYAGIRDRRPFDGWSSEAPTKTLAWYNAYNLTKHNRETAFACATLKHAFDAIAACAIATFAQYGRLPVGESSTSEFLAIKAIPKWLTFNCYTKIGYSPNDWEKLSYPFR